MPTKISSHCHWEGENALVMKLKYVENVHHDIFTFTFADQEMKLSFDNSLSYRSEQGEERPDLWAEMR